METKIKQYIAQVDNDDKIIGQIERWKAHELGILHRGFTITLKYENKIILQHRRHPAFDDVFDVTISSHQLFIDGHLQPELMAVSLCLEREWGLSPSDFIYEPKLRGQIYYKSKDRLSMYTEHEICSIYECELKKLADPNPEFAYGMSLKTVEDLKNKNSNTYKMLAPWVVEIIKNGLV